MAEEPSMYRQGDVLLVRLDALPEGAEPVPDEDRVVLAYGEATGHAHALVADAARRYRWQGGTLVEVGPGARLVHEEHAAIALPPGVYQVVRQREYAPADRPDELPFRWVAD